MRRWGWALVVAGGMMLPCLARGQMVEKKASTRGKITNPANPEECTPWVNQQISARMKAAFGKGKDETIRDAIYEDSMPKWQRELTEHCASRFGISKVPQAQLAALAMLYANVGQLDSARAAARRNLDLAKEDGRADALLAAIRVEMAGAEQVVNWRKSHPSPDRVADAEKLADQLAALGPDATVQKVEAFNLLAKGYYEESVDKSRQHLEKAVGFASQLTPEQRVAHARAVAESYAELGKIYIQLGRPDKVVSTFEAGLAALSNADMAGELRALRNQYAMVGKPAPEIKVYRWLNGSAEPKNVPLEGKVTVVEFTSHG